MQRAAQTRSALVEAATSSFAVKGWAGTSMRDVARSAGVAVETLYSHFSSKRALLQAVADHAVVGDDAPVALAERAEFVALGHGRRPQRVEAAAVLVSEVNSRTISIAKVLREAASSDPEIAASLRDTRERQRQDVERGLGLILGRGPTEGERDGVWAIVSPEVYLLLVEVSGWSFDRYRTWIATTLASVLPRS